MALWRSEISEWPSMALHSVVKDFLKFTRQSVLNLPLRLCSTLINGEKNAEINHHLTLMQNSKKRKDVLQSRKKILNLIRTDENIEKAARNRQLEIPLDKVKKEWSTTKGLKEVAFLARYYAIFRDIFDGEEFKPVVWLDITYGSNSVHRGNILEPAKCLNKPAVHFASTHDKYHAILLLNPEGCWPCANAEVLHWMMINIPGNNTEEGKELEYLAPMPWQGSGFHRFCFVLFEQNGIINDDLVNINDINRFEFRTRDLLSKTNAFKPVGLSWFQSQWDESVTVTAHKSGIFEPKFAWQDITDPKELNRSRDRKIRQNKYRIKFNDDDILL